MGLKEAREFFLSQFSVSELGQLTEFLERIGMPPLLNLFPYRTYWVFQHFNKLLFETPDVIEGVWFSDGMRYDLYPIIKEIPRLKKMVADALVLYSIPIKKSSEIPKPLPPRVVIQLPIVSRTRLVPTAFHKNTGEVVITRHAWERWLQRFANMPFAESRQQPISGEFLLKLKKSFLGAVRINLPNNIAFKRLLNNRCEPARYFRNQKDGFCFVVSERKPAALLTVEPARELSRHMDESWQLPSWYQRYRKNKKTGLTD